MSVAQGDERVRKDFNPSGSEQVAEIKKRAAELIDYCDQFKYSGEQARCAALAQTAFEEGAMWAVKAATWKV